MTTRRAACACGRVTLVVETEPAVVSICHCDFCQKRTGSVFQIGAYFGPDEPFAITGETRAYNGLEQDGAASVSGTSVTYHFCPTCGSTVYWEVEGLYRGLPVGNFVDPDFPPPTQELHTADRHRWLTPTPGAEQLPGAFGQHRHPARVASGLPEDLLLGGEQAAGPALPDASVATSSYY